MVRSEAQKRAYAAWVPGTSLEVPYTPYADPALAGKRLIYAKMGLLLRYEYSFVSGVDGELYYGGVVLDKVRGVGVRVGSAWAWKAKEMRVIT